MLIKFYAPKGKGNERDAKVTWWVDLSGELNPIILSYPFLLSADYNCEVEIASRPRSPLSLINSLGTNQLVWTERSMQIRHCSCLKRSAASPQAISAMDSHSHFQTCLNGNAVKNV